MVIHIKLVKNISQPVSSVRLKRRTNLIWLISQIRLPNRLKWSPMQSNTQIYRMVPEWCMVLMHHSKQLYFFLWQADQTGLAQNSNSLQNGTNKTPYKHISIETRRRPQTIWNLLLCKNPYSVPNATTYDSIWPNNCYVIKHLKLRKFHCQRHRVRGPAKIKYVQPLF